MELQHKVLSLEDLLVKNNIHEYLTYEEGIYEKIKAVEKMVRHDKSKLQEYKETINEKSMKLSLTRKKCQIFENQFKILMDLLNLPINERNFSALRQAMEDKIQEACNEKERADHLATVMS